MTKFLLRRHLFDAKTKDFINLKPNQKETKQIQITYYRRGVDALLVDETDKLSNLTFTYLFCWKLSTIRNMNQ